MFLQKKLNTNPIQRNFEEVFGNLNIGEDETTGEQITNGSLFSTNLMSKMPWIVLSFRVELVA